jgi:pimeloyl-ACP methyl ester carboxylesterase
VAAKVAPFRVSVSEDEVEDLRSRLRATRYIAEPPVPDWRSGVPVGYLRDLLRYWREGFDWHAVEDRINSFTNVRVDLDGLALHCLRVPGRGPSPIPIVLVHGWPGSFVEMLDLAVLLSDPAATGADPIDSFDVVIPSLPGFGHSDAPRSPTWGRTQTAEAVARLMTFLGYERFGIHTYDIGASIMSALCLSDPDRVIGYHTTEPGIPGPEPRPDPDSIRDDERIYLDYAREWEAQEGGYFGILATRPQTLGHALNDSPAGLAAWIVEKWWSWTVPEGSGASLHDFLSMDQVLSNITLYWHTRSINSANWTYFVTAGRTRVAGERAIVPVGVALTTQRIERAPRAWAERFFPDIRRWEDLGAGGHFVTMERPDLVARAIRAFFRSLR